MGWADGHIAKLAQARPCSSTEIVFCRVKGNQYLHLVKAIQGERYQIGNNRGGINGWITRRQIFGKLIAIAP